MLDWNQNDLQKIEALLAAYVEDQGEPLHTEILSSMRYSLMAGGKRLRPLLTLAFCRLCGGDAEAALPFACAVEMIHTYSLIHDDLPCMDDDAMRRGRPTNHCVYGEGLAVVAGDALQALAFDVMLRPQTLQLAGAERAAKAAQILAECAGARGMCGGQAIDLLAEGKKISIETLREMDREKTCALIDAAVRMGCVVAGANEEQLAAAKRYAMALGLAFQIVDDLLDLEGDAEMMGKATGSDAAHEKCTYVSLLGKSRAEELVKSMTEEAVDALAAFHEGTEPLKALALALAKRQS